MAFFNTSADALLINDLERAYPNMAFGGNFAALIGIMKKEDRSGDAVKVPIKTDFGAGQGATASTAYNNATLAGRYAFVVTPFVVYGQSKIPLQQDAFTKADEQSAIDLLLDESKTAMDSCKMQVDQALAGDGSGTIGTIVSNSGGGPGYTLVLDSTAAALSVTVGANYVSKATPFAGSLDVSGTAFFTVNSVSAATKTITVTASNSWAPTNTHVFGLQGTMQASTSFVVWPGIPGWIPPAASRPVSGSDSFFSVNRSVNEQKLAGTYTTSTDILEGINDIASAVANVPGANPDTAVMSYINLGKVKAQLQTQRRYVEGTVASPGVAGVFFKSVVISGPTGDIDIVASSHWRNDLVAVLDRSTWVCASPGNKPFVPATPDGNPIQNIPGQDQAVAAYRSALFVYCHTPGYNGMLTVTTASA